MGIKDVSEAQWKHSVYFKYRDWDSIPKPIVDSAIKEILLTTKKEISRPPKEWVVLDVGCGSGEYGLELGRYVQKVVGVEPFKPLHDLAIRNKRKESGVVFVNSLIENLKTSEKFDLVVSMSTIEHMPNAEKSFKRIFSLMSKGGIIYLTAPNKWWPLEPHYKLPFLSWLPLPLANLYLKTSGRGQSYKDSAFSKSYFGMRAFFDKFPCRYKFVLPNDPHSAYFGYASTNFFYNVMKNLGIFLIKKFPLFWIFSKGFIMVIRKV